MWQNSFPLNENRREKVRTLFRPITLGIRQYSYDRRLTNLYWQNILEYIS
ncbi:Uncharacterised protein [Niallia circulans]|nr:Uncharacterised protein [Niallia circulans]